MGEESSSGMSPDGNESRGGVLDSSSYANDSPMLVDPDCPPPVPAPPPVAVWLLKSPPLAEEAADPRMLEVGRRLLP